jgi:SlyX protein
MTDIEVLTERLNAVETHLAHQQETIRDLSDVAAAQWRAIDALQRRVVELTGRLQSVQAGAGTAADEPPPPHY